MKTFHLLPKFSDLTLTISKYEASGSGSLKEIKVTVCNIKYVVNLAKDPTKISAINFLQLIIPDKEITQKIF